MAEVLELRFERVAQKYVRVAVVTRISRDDGIKSFGEPNLLHECFACSQSAAQ